MPSSLWSPLDIVPRVLFNIIDLGRSKHHFMRLQPLGLLQEFPADEDDGEDADHQVGEEERGDVPLALEGVRITMNLDVWGASHGTYLVGIQYTHQQKS